MIKLANSSIYQKIEEKGKKEAQEILSAGKKEAKQLEKSILEGYEEKYNKAIEDANRTNAEYLKTKITQIEQQAKQESLSAKKSYINKVIEGALKEMNKMSDQELLDLTVRTIKADTINGDEALQVNKGDFNKYQKLLPTINEKLGKGYKLSLSKDPADIEGGFIIVGKTFDIDHSFVALLEELKEQNEAELAEILFGNGKASKKEKK